MLKASTIPVIQMRSKTFRGKIELLKEKALIGKFVGIWLKEKDLVKWINNVWNPLAIMICNWDLRISLI